LRPTWQVKGRLDPDGAEMVSWSLTGPKQGRRAPVDASRQHDPRRPDLDQAAAVWHGHTGRAPATDKHLLDQRITGHDEPVTDRIGIAARVPQLRSIS
jgi:hypothetical protein